MSATSRTGGGLLPDRHPTADFFVCDFLDVSLKDDLGTMEHPIFSLATRPDRRVLSYAHNDVQVQVTPSVRGRATIHDKDILIYCVSQLMAALNAGREISRTLHLKAHDLLVATNRDTSGDAYARLKEAFERLAGTRITTNLATGGVETTSGFGLIEAWEIVRRSRGGRMMHVTITLSDWLFRAVLSRSVLTLNRDYFRLRKPLERRIYELARKHCGRQAEWTVSVATLHKKAGSAAPLRVFRAALRRMIEAGNLPDYTLREAPGDLIVVTRETMIEVAGAPLLDPRTLDVVREIMPGADVHALAAQWQAWWASSGRKRLSDPQAAFLGWVRTQDERG
ncbi:Replication initiator protein A (plasmid) [Roseovarius sp. THAF27]|uniref:replication initiator protein A n=1 Tax=unclassified Roseovarius TaxID=2614913 RepID=UPI0012A9FB68|nr:MULTISPECIES: replication initiator protein A [unclassified Roseovarius]QFT83284.1 Replication initiator protein A [Roseovarius sp. THAF27]QFT99954.1 Replication initiator protein A [Roseovarius sp. THAF8]